MNSIRLIATNFVIYPFLHIIGFIDFIIGLIVPYKYEDNQLPNKTICLSEQTDKSDPTSAYRSTLFNDLIACDDFNANVYDEFKLNYKRFAQISTLGVRELFSIDDEVQPNGKVFKKFNLGSYKWQTYEQMHDRIERFSSGLLNIGLKSNQNVVLFAETRPEWLISAFACFRIKAPVVTLYSTLGVDAFAYGINQTKSNFVITSGDQIDKVERILVKVPQLTHLIVFTDKFSEKNVLDFKKRIESNAQPRNLFVYLMSEVETIGNQQSAITTFIKPKRDDLAIIMYTSGSTGNPKGVMMSHGNILTSTRAVRTRLGSIYLNKDIYIAYLPLAHVLELVCELTCCLNGVRLGYSSPQTIVDTSTAIKKGHKGDLRVLKPTIMAAVPIILERLSKTVYEKLSTTNWFKQTLFNIAYKYKLEYFRAGRSSRLLDRVLFKRISRAVLGGKCRLMLSGGAILSKEVHEFVQVCLCPAIQAYGLTETCGAATSQLPNQTETEVVGSVLPCSEIRLIDWPEAGYRCTDKPNPRGEIYIGGSNVTMGYYEMPEKTAEDFKFINGIRYFATGDIGEMLPNGDLKIIDRKKDLVKLQGGEYLSLNKVESVLKLLPFVDNCCVVANGLKSNCVVLVCPNVKKIKSFLIDEGVEVNEDSNPDKLIVTLCNLLEKHSKQDEKLIKEMYKHCLAHGLEKFEIPSKIGFVKEIWLPDTGLVTDSLKLKRKEIERFYKSHIDTLYNQCV
jgi:long-chain acyl-CoA synthetase